MSSSLRTTLPTLFALLLGYALMQVGNTLQGTLLSVRGSIEQFTPTEIGAVGAAFWAGIVIGSLYAGRVIQQVGHTRTFAALAAVAASTVLLHLLVISPAVWIAARGLTGFCFAGLFIVVESWLNASASAQTRGQVLSVYGMTGLVAGIGGQMLLPTGDPLWLQAVLLRRHPHLACPGAYGPVAGECAGSCGERHEDQPDAALPAIALRRGGSGSVRHHHELVLRARADLGAGARIGHGGDRHLHDLRHARRLSHHLAPGLALRPHGSPPCDRRHRRHGGGDPARAHPFRAARRCRFGSSSST